MTPAGLYIHIPFCKSKCPYCHFYSSLDLHLIDPFIAALHMEMARYARNFPLLDTVYIGGGTPSLLRSEQLGAILDGISRNYSIQSDGEITIEVNPADGTDDWYRDLRNLGINRVHLGAQSFCDAALCFLGRRHCVDDIYRSVNSIIRAGFDNFGLDLIYGIPGQDVNAWKESLALAVALKASHLSAYQLTGEEDTPLGLELQDRRLELPGEEASLTFFLETAAALTASGYVHYEVSNFAVSFDRTSRHNQKYWGHKPYLGLGPAAHSFRDGRRWWNCRRIENYLTALHSGQLPLGGEEWLSAEELQLETLFLGLRTAAGIDLDAFRRRFHTDPTTTHDLIVTSLIADGFLVHTGNRLHPTTRGLAVADRLALLF